VSDVLLNQATPLPWQQLIQEKLVRLNTDTGLAHSLLMGGPAGIGKAHLAKSLAFALLCRQKGAVACGQCSSCRLVMAGSHSDLRWIQPEDSLQIKIDQIRQLVGWANQTARQGGIKVAVIEPAERMNLNAANALLKILEEPAAYTFFILVSAIPAGLLATIRSRCQQISVLRPGQDQALAWLKQVLPASDETELQTALHLAVGSPLSAFELLRDGRSQRQTELLALMTQLVNNKINPVLAAKQAQDKTHPQDIYDLLYWLLSECLRRDVYELSGGGLSPVLEETIIVFSAIFSAEQLLLIIEQVVSARRLLIGTGNPNQEQLLESLLIQIFDVSQRHIN